MSASIKSVFVEDFQSHQKTRIELPGPGQLCVIVGPTDSGKTAIVRALRLLLYNVPLGTEFIRVGRNMATVAVELSNGTKVARERSKSVNRYRIVEPGESPQVLEGFGLSVPQEVQEATGVRVVSIGDTIDLALNLSEQLDGPFLGKSVSGPAKAKILGALAGTEEVDKARDDVGLDVHRAGQEETRLADEIKALDARIQEYDYLPELATQIEALDGILAQVKQARERLTALEVVRDKLASLYTQQRDSLEVLAQWGGLTQAVSHVEYAEGAVTKMQALGGHKASLTSIAAQRVEWGGRLRRWAGLDEGSTAYNEAYLAILRQEMLIGLKNDLSTTRAGIIKAQATLTRWAILHDATVAHASASDAAAWLKDLLPLRDRLASIGQQRATALAAEKRWTNLEDATQVASTIRGLDDRLQALRSYSQAKRNIHLARVLAEQDLGRHTKALTDAQSLYSDTLVAMGTCPLCGSVVDPDSIKSHIKEVA